MPNRHAHLQKMARHTNCCILVPLRGNERGREGKSAGLRVEGRGGGRGGGGGVVVDGTQAWSELVVAAFTDLLLYLSSSCFLLCSGVVIAESILEDVGYITGTTLVAW